MIAVVAILQSLTPSQVDSGISLDNKLGVEVLGSVARFLSRLNQFMLLELGVSGNVFICDHDTGISSCSSQHVLGHHPYTNIDGADPFCRYVFTPLGYPNIDEDIVTASAVRPPLF